MKLLLSFAIWFAAVFLAVWVLYRLVRNKPMLLHGLITRRAIRIAAIVMVTLGANRTQAQPAEGQAPESLVALAQDARALFGQRDAAPWHQAWLSEDRRQTPDAEAAPNLRRVLDFAADRAEDDPPPEPLSAETIAQALQEMQQDARLFNEPFNLLLWHELQALPAPADAEEAAMLAAAMGRVSENARMLNTLVRAQSESGISLQISPRAWASKAGPRPGDYRLEDEDIGAFVQSVDALYATSDTGLWEREGVLQLSADANAGSVAIIRQRQTIVMEAGTNHRVTRLDLLQTGEAGGRLNSDWLGDLNLPANATLRMSDLPALLDDAARQRIDEAIALAVDGDEDALLLLERHMPLCVPQIVEAIPPQAPLRQQAVGLRLLVYLYDPMRNHHPSHWHYFEHAVGVKYEGAGWMDSPDVPVERGEIPQGGGRPGGLGPGPGLGGGR